VDFQGLPVRSNFESKVQALGARLGELDRAHHRREAAGCGQDLVLSLWPGIGWHCQLELTGVSGFRLKGSSTVNDQLDNGPLDHPACSVRHDAAQKYCPRRNRDRRRT